MPTGIWDQPGHQWDRGYTWQGSSLPPGAGWGADWRFWYQVGSTVTLDLTELVVEARWTTDGHTPGDGTIRGDLQPGKATIRMWDPTFMLDGLDKTGTLWATYVPTGACWCWFFDNIARPLVAPGDPAGADTVYTGNSLPGALTGPVFAIYAQGGRPQESAANRLADLFTQARLNQIVNPPPMASSIAAQSQAVAAVPVAAVDAHTLPAYPAWLQLARDAAADGILWFSAAGSGPGTWTMHYDRWETVNAARIMNGGQVVAGPPITQGAGFVFAYVDMTATRYDAYSTVLRQYAGGGAGTVDVAMRMVGDIENTTGTGGRTGPEYAGANATTLRLASDHGSPSERYLSSVTAQSGARFKAGGGGPSQAPWDPHAHVWSPLDVMQYTDPEDSRTYSYRVASSSHVLNAAMWQTVHTLEKYSPATALP